MSDVAHNAALLSAAGLGALSVYLFRRADDRGVSPPWTAYLSAFTSVSLAAYLTPMLLGTPRLTRETSERDERPEPEGPEATAIKRDAPSEVVQRAVELGYVQSPALDWGSGHGADVHYLQLQGFTAYGYDPYLQPVLPPRRDARYGQMLWVFDVIERPADRVKAVNDFASYLAPGAIAFFTTSTPERVAEMFEDVPEESFERVGDGIKTDVGAFFRGYTPSELEELVQTGPFDIDLSGEFEINGVATTFVHAKRAL